MRLLLSFCDFGLGDAVQFGIVLKHLKHYHPDWTIGIETNKGHWDCFRGLADEIFPLVMPFSWRNKFDKIQTIKFLTPDHFYGTKVPSTKPTRCLIEEFGLEPIK